MAYSCAIVVVVYFVDFCVATAIHAKIFESALRWHGEGPESAPNGEVTGIAQHFWSNVERMRVFHIPQILLTNMHLSGQRLWTNWTLRSCRFSKPLLTLVSVSTPR